MKHAITPIVIALCCACAPELEGPCPRQVVDSYHNASNNADLDELRGVTEINNLSITDAVTNLEALSCLRTVHRLSVTASSSLTTLRGLEGLDTARHVLIVNNPELTSLDGLGLRGARDIWIDSNPRLETVELHNLEYVGSIEVGQCMGEVVDTGLFAEIGDFPSLKAIGSLNVYGGTFKSEDGGTPDSDVGSTLFSSDSLEKFIMQHGAKMERFRIEGYAHIDWPALVQAWADAGGDPHDFLFDDCEPRE